MSQPKHAIHRVEHQPLADFDDQFWPINVLLLVLASFVAGLILAQGDFHAAAWWENAWLHLGVLVAAMIGLVVAMAMLGRVMQRRMQLAVLGSLIAHLVLWLSMTQYYLPLAQVRQAGAAADQEPKVTLPDYQQPKRADSPPDRILREMQTPAAKVAVATPTPPRPKPKEDFEKPPVTEKPVDVRQPQPMDMQRREQPAPRRADRAEQRPLSRQELSRPEAKTAVEIPKTEARTDPKLAAQSAGERRAAEAPPAERPAPTESTAQANAAKSEAAPARRAEQPTADALAQQELAKTSRAATAQSTPIAEAPAASHQADAPPLDAAQQARARAAQAPARNNLGEPSTSPAADLAARPDRSARRAETSATTPSVANSDMRRAALRQANAPEIQVAAVTPAAQASATPQVSAATLQAARINGVALPATGASSTAAPSTAAPSTAAPSTAAPSTSGAAESQALAMAGSHQPSRAPTTGSALASNDPSASAAALPRQSASGAIAAPQIPATSATTGDVAGSRQRMPIDAATGGAAHHETSAPDAARGTASLAGSGSAVDPNGALAAVGVPAGRAIEGGASGAPVGGGSIGGIGEGREMARSAAPGTQGLGGMGAVVVAGGGAPSAQMAGGGTGSGLDAAPTSGGRDGARGSNGPPGSQSTTLMTQGPAGGADRASADLGGIGAAQRPGGGPTMTSGAGEVGLGSAAVSGKSARDGLSGLAAPTVAGVPGGLANGAAAGRPSAAGSTGLAPATGADQLAALRTPGGASAIAVDIPAREGPGGLAEGAAPSVGAMNPLARRDLPLARADLGRVDLPKSNDRFGNPIGENFGLAVDGQFKGKRLVAWRNDPGPEPIFQPNNPLWEALKTKGFVVSLQSGPFRPEWLDDAEQLWIFSGASSQIDPAALTAIEQFVGSGRGLYLLADNEPYVAEADLLAQRFYGIRVAGVYQGDKTIAVRGRGTTDADLEKSAMAGSKPELNAAPGRYDNTPVTHYVDEHPLLEGINFIYEGITISHLNASDKLQTVLTASDRQILAVVSKVNRHRVVIDCGYTRYFPQYVRETAGTLRYAQNVAAYLMGVEDARPNEE